MKTYDITINGHNLLAYVEEHERKPNEHNPSNKYEVVITIPFIWRPKSLMDDLYRKEYNTNG